MTGILRLVPEQLAPVSIPGAPIIHASVDRGERRASNMNSADFEFSAVQFGGPESYRYQTKLSGALDEWSAPTENSHLSLAGLQNGTYEFSVRVVNESGQAGPASTWSFTVLPPWYRTVPAMIVFVLLIAAGVFGAFKWRLAFLKRQNARLEILVQKKTEQLEKANEAKSEFLANMSHEIRNPISGILGLSFAFQETNLDKRQRHLVDSINSCANLLAALVDDVLDFSKIEAGKIELRSAPFSLKVLLEQCIAMIAENAKTAGTPISLEISPELPEQIVGDSARVQQILLNYLTNALKFGAGKPITVGASPGFHDRVRFFVRDQGMGMTEAEIATLFTKFTRLESARTGNIRGTGLGLAVSRLLATKMGGRVGVESKPGKGSTFWAELPFIVVSGSGDPKAAQVAGIGTLRALIVEDIDYNVIAMQAVLRKLDIQSDVVNDGAQALERLQSTHYDVAFLDWNLPGMIGTEVAARYRAVEPSTRRTIIIATTAHSSDMNKEACLQAGMDAFISKPITPGKIAAALRDLGGPMRTAASIEVRSQNITFEPPGEIDLEMLTFLGNETLEGLGGQVDRFLASFDTDRMTARRIIASGVPTEIHRIAHRLMSHCSVVKYEPLGRIARDIQNASSTASPKELQRMFAEFEKEFASFKCKLESIRASTGSA
jgi:signal transduction histidine kinase/CheY-like chemotaxis protein